MVLRRGGREDRPGFLREPVELQHQLAVLRRVAADALLLSREGEDVPHRAHIGLLPNLPEGVVGERGLDLIRARKVVPEAGLDGLEPRCRVPHPGVVHLSDLVQRVRHEHPEFGAGLLDPGSFIAFRVGQLFHQVHRALQARHEVRIGDSRGDGLGRHPHAGLDQLAGILVDIALLRLLDLQLIEPLEGVDENLQGGGDRVDVLEAPRRAVFEADRVRLRCRAILAGLVLLVVVVDPAAGDRPRGVERECRASQPEADHRFPLSPHLAHHAVGSGQVLHEPRGQ